MGFVIFIVIGVYLIISFGVVAWAVNHALDRGKNPAPWALSAALVMFLIPCWDWIPTVVAHKYYCEKEAGFWVYKTLDQWKTENPGVIEMLVANKGEPSSRQGDMVNYIDTYFVNQRINWVVKQNDIAALLSVIRREQEVVDIKDGKILARQIDFGSYDRTWNGLKFWMSIQHCNEGRDYINKFGNFANQFKGAEK